MQPVLLKSRVAAGHAAFGGSNGHVKHARRQAVRQGVSTVAVAAIEEPQTSNMLDKEDAYRRFDSLLDEYSVSFSTGDKVRLEKQYTRFTALILVYK